MDKGKVFKNENGNAYTVIGVEGDDTLLVRQSDGEVVVAWKLDWNNKCWASGRYFGTGLNAMSSALEYLVEGA